MYELLLLLSLFTHQSNYTVVFFCYYFIFLLRIGSPLHFTHYCLKVCLLGKNKQHSVLQDSTNKNMM